jgi:hypothetical protein
MFTSIFIAMKILLQEILEKEDFQYGKHNKKFNEDDQPYLPPPARHISEAVKIKAENPVKH